MDKQPPENKTILTVVKSSQLINENSEPCRFADHRIGNFEIKNRILIKHHTDRAGHPLIIPLFLNGAALIQHEIVTDDGIQENRFFVMIGITAKGEKLPPIRVPASQFPSMNWLLQYGNKIIPSPGNGNKDNQRAAIQVLSCDVDIQYVYRHTGWRTIDGQWLFLHGNGAIGSEGENPQISVELDPGNMQRYKLPAPTVQEARRHVGLALDILDVSKTNPVVGVAILCAVARAPLAEVSPIDFSIFFVGRSGSGKSECAALAQAFFGDFNGRALPANFSDTESDLQHKSHQAKDYVFVVDEFCPSINTIEANKLHASAEILFRSVGNLAGRGRRNADMSAKPAYHPRGMVIATGEDTPRGASLLGRILVVEMRRGDLEDSLSSAMQHQGSLSTPKWPAMTEFQRHARDGRLQQIMADYVRWLAPRIDDLKRQIPARQIELREAATKAGFATSHPRAADIYASLAVGFSVFMDFLTDSEAVGDVRAGDVMEHVTQTLQSVLKAQGEYQENADEVEIFKNLLQSCFSSGSVHISDHLNQGPPIRTPHAFGWRARTQGGDVEGHGIKIGWINEVANELWLEPEETFRAIKRLSGSQDEAFLTSKATLWKRLLERGVIICSEPNAKTKTSRPTVKRTVAGVTSRVLVFSPTIVTIAGG